MVESELRTGYFGAAGQPNVSAIGRRKETIVASAKAIWAVTVIDERSTEIVGPKAKQAIDLTWSNEKGGKIV
jgi:hypothetical protein